MGLGYVPSETRGPKLLKQLDAADVVLNYLARIFQHR